MSNRNTKTEKWESAFFSNLTIHQKLLYFYLNDNCDMAGFIEIIPKRWKADLDFTDAQLRGALEGLSRGLIFCKSNDCLYIKDFLKDQNNLPLNPQKNNFHLGIVKRFEYYRDKFDITDIDEFINQESKPLSFGEVEEPEKPKTSQFTKPTIEEVKEYCLERKNSVDAERFIDFYTSKDWKIGKNSMKDWKAAVRTWEKPNNNTTNGKPNYQPEWAKQKSANESFKTRIGSALEELTNS